MVALDFPQYLILVQEVAESTEVSVNMVFKSLVSS